MPTVHRRWWWILGAVCLVAIAASQAEFSAGEVDLSQRLEGPSLSHPLGTDQLGRGLAQRLLAGGITSLGAATFTLVLAGVFGTGLGVAAGAIGGRVFVFLTALTDALVAIPSIVVAIVVVSILQPGLIGVIAAMTCTGWLPFARLSLQLTRQEVAMEYVEAARFSGASSIQVLWGTVLPNISRPLLAHGILRFPGKLIIFSSLSFLGLGPQPPTPEWGAMLAQGVAELERTPLLVIAPGSCIALSGIVAAMFGRRLEDAAAKGTSRPTI